jgi:hypothetical protein
LSINSTGMFSRLVSLDQTRFLPYLDADKRGPSFFT